jgi:hypothetical protein
MSFALMHQSKNKAADSKISTSAKRSPSHHHDHINSLAMYSHDSIIHLQRTIGNQAVQRLMANNVPFNFAKIDIQPKLKVSQPGDIYEQEADRVAEQVMRISISDPITSNISRNHQRIDRRKCSACEMKEKEEEEEKKNLNISRKPSTISNLETTDEITNKIHCVGTTIEQFFQGRELENYVQKQQIIIKCPKARVTYLPPTIIK